MIFNGIECDIISTTIAYESGIEWKNACGRIFGIDYGIETDHASTSVIISGEVEIVSIFKARVEDFFGENVDFHFSDGELPFGPLYNCGKACTLMVLKSGDLKTTEKGSSEYEFTLATYGTKLPFKYPSLSLELNNFAVQNVSRENTPDSNNAMLINGWSVHAHDWTDRRFSLTLSGSCDKLGGTLRWLIERRTQTFGLSCYNSMSLIDGHSAENLAILAFGNLKRVGNSGIWEVDLLFGEASP